MSTFGSPGGPSKLSKPLPPQKGSFPLDHYAECKEQMSAYLKCLKGNRYENSDDCRELSKGYLQCRMEKGLMAEEKLVNLGFRDKQDQGAGSGA